MVSDTILVATFFEIFYSTTITAMEGGTTLPTGSITTSACSPTLVTATPDVGYKFSH